MIPIKPDSKEGEDGDVQDDPIIYRDTPVRPLKPNSKEISYVNTINLVLPPEIRVLAWASLPKDFNAR